MFEIPLCFQRNLQIVRLHFAWVSAHKTKVMKMKTKNVAKNVLKGRHDCFSMIIIYKTEILLQKNKTKINSILFFILFLVSAKKN